MRKVINTPLDAQTIKGLRVGDTVFLSGTIYTARDMAHQRLVELIRKKKELPFDVRGAVIYYTGPTPAPPGRIIGSCGPTSSYRLDGMTEPLLRKGLSGMIGKGKRSSELRKALKKHRACYFAAVGGAAALIAEKILSCKIIAFPELGTEAVRELRVKEFPVTVANDTYGGDIFEKGKKKFSGK
jgi:fumarate hydratase subunit beta